jgi:hypothetical protein
MAECIAHGFGAAAQVAVVPLPYEVTAFTIDLIHARGAMADPTLRRFIEIIDRVCKLI